MCAGRGQANIVNKSCGKWVWYDQITQLTNSGEYTQSPAPQQGAKTCRSSTSRRHLEAKLVLHTQEKSELAKTYQRQALQERRCWPTRSATTKCDTRSNSRSNRREADTNCSDYTEEHRTEAEHAQAKELYAKATAQ